MIPIETFRELFDYYYWARDTQLGACAKLTAEEFTKPLGSSHSSVRDTLLHLLVSEYVWTLRWRARPVEGIPAAEDFSTVADLRGRWRLVETETRGHLNTLTDEALAESFSFTNMEGIDVTCRLWQTLYHFLNHQSYHRGQITTLLRQLGAGVPTIDFATRFLPTRK